MRKRGKHGCEQKGSTSIAHRNGIMMFTLPFNRRRFYSLLRCYFGNIFSLSKKKKGERESRGRTRLLTQYSPKRESCTDKRNKQRMNRLHENAGGP